MTLQRAVLDLRTHLGLDGAQFGKVLGVSRQTVSYWEKGTYVPSSTHLARMAQLAKTSKAADEISEALEAAIAGGAVSPTSDT